MYACTAARRTFSRAPMNLLEFLCDGPEYRKGICLGPEYCKGIDEEIDTVRDAQVLSIIVDIELSKLPEKEKKEMQEQAANYIAAGHLNSSVRIAEYLKQPPEQLREFAGRESRRLEDLIERRLLQRCIKKTENGRK